MLKNDNEAQKKYQAAMGSAFNMEGASSKSNYERLKGNVEKTQHMSGVRRVKKIPIQSIVNTILEEPVPNEENEIR